MNFYTVRLAMNIYANNHQRIFPFVCYYQLYPTVSCAVAKISRSNTSRLTHVIGTYRYFKRVASLHDTGYREVAHFHVYLSLTPARQFFILTVFQLPVIVCGDKIIRSDYCLVPRPVGCLVPMIVTSSCGPSYCKIQQSGKSTKLIESTYHENILPFRY